MPGQARGRTVLAVNLAREEQTRRCAVRAIGRAQRVTRGLGRWGLWGSILLFAGLYGVLTLLAWCYYVVVSNGLGFPAGMLFGPWSVIAMTLVPLWASLLVLLSAATAFPLERAAGTLDALRLTSLPASAVQRALIRPRLRFGLIVLLIAAPFYLLPRWLPDTGLPENPVILHSLHSLAAGRGYFFLALPRYLDGPWVASDSWFVPWGLVVDATRLYAMAVIGTVASLRIRSVGTAAFWAVAGASAFLAVTVGAEWAGISALRAVSSAGLWSPEGRALEEALMIVSPAAVALEAGVINLLLPWLLLRGARRRGEDWLSREG